MDDANRIRLFGYDHAFDEPVTVGAAIALAIVLLISPLLILLLARLKKITPEHKTELMRRYYSWLVLVPILAAPILLGAFWTILGIGLLSTLCYREFARATGLFRDKMVSLLVTLSIICLFLSVLDKWYGLFVALTPLGVGMVAAFSILEDRPKGYIQRVALGILSLMLFGSCMGHLAYFANDKHYRPMLILIFLAVELNDVFAYIAGKLFGREKLAPNTSPNKTIAGSVGALILTTLLMLCVGGLFFPPGDDGRDIAVPWHLAAMGLIVSVAGQLGDLMLSSIKRDLGLKDMGSLIPGHGGLLDRFDSIILVGPALFHYIHYFRGIGVDNVAHIFTGN